MRTSVLTAILAAVICTAGCSSTTVTRQELMQTSTTSQYVRSRFFYMGSRDGFDYVTHAWEDFRGRPASRILRLRTGELHVGPQMPFTSDAVQWRQLDIYKR